jgi:hypothetical protein
MEVEAVFAVSTQYILQTLFLLIMNIGEPL